LPSGFAALSFLLLPPKEKKQKKSHRCMKIAKNLRHSLNCGNSSPDSPLTRRSGSSNSPQFFTLIPRFPLRNFHEAVNFYFYLKFDTKEITVAA
jgi:hypothetical protein